MQLDNEACVLPIGIVDEQGMVHRHALIRPLSGIEEAMLARPNIPGTQQVNQLLAQCVQRIGNITAIDENVTAALTLVDRHYLLIRLRMLTFGDLVQATLQCPHCQARVDVDFALSDIPMPERQGEPVVQATVALQSLPSAAPHDALEIRFRLPNGDDQACLADLVLDNEVEASQRLMSRCLLQVGELTDPSFEDIRGLPAGVRSIIEQAMAQNAQLLDLDMDVHCPECKQSFVAPFDIQDFFLNEISINRGSLVKEVHYLAYHYHWSEREIMTMPRHKRRMYIGVLSDEIQRLNDVYG